MCLVDAIQQHAKAIILMKRNQHDEAVRYFGKMVYTLMQIGESASPNAQETTIDCCSVASGGPIIYPLCLPAMDAAMNTEFSPLSSSFMVYNKAFAVMTPAAAERMMMLSEMGTSGCPTGLCNCFATPKSILLYTAVALYNMGLSLQRQGIQTCCSCALKKAQTIYQMAFSNLHQYEQTALTQIQPSMQSGDDDVDISILKLALINNLGHIDSTFFNIDRVEQWRIKLEDCLEIFLYHQEQQELQKMHQRQEQQHDHHHHQVDDEDMSYMDDDSLGDARINNINYNNSDSNHTTILFDDEDCSFFLLGMLCSATSDESILCAGAA